MPTLQEPWFSGTTWNPTWEFVSMVIQIWKPCHTLMIWLKPETDYWKSYLINLIQDHFKETESKIAKKILDNFDEEIKKFVQVCPKEMVNKVSNPLSLKKKILEAV